MYMWQNSNFSFNISHLHWPSLPKSVSFPTSFQIFYLQLFLLPSPPSTTLTVLFHYFPFFSQRKGYVSDPPNLHHHIHHVNLLSSMQKINKLRTKTRGVYVCVCVCVCVSMHKCLLVQIFDGPFFPG